MTKQEPNFQRIENLNKVIEQLYGHVLLSEMEGISGNFDNVITDMFQVTKIKNDHFELTHLFEDDVYAPVQILRPMQHLLRKGDTFLIAMGIKEGSWRPIYVSPTYF